MVCCDKFKYRWSTQNSVRLAYIRVYKYSSLSAVLQTTDWWISQPHRRFLFIQPAGCTLARPLKWCSVSGAALCLCNNSYRSFLLFSASTHIHLPSIIYPLCLYALASCLPRAFRAPHNIAATTNSTRVYCRCWCAISKPTNTHTNMHSLTKS